MNKLDFKNLCRSRTVILDGATGTELTCRGMPSGVSPELYVLENPEVINAIHNAYFDAGSHLAYIPSFGANRCKLAEFGAENRVREVNLRLAENSKRNAERRGKLVFGDVSPTGEFLKPFGSLEFDDLVEIYAEQISALTEGGADGIAVETMFDLQQTRAALIAAKETAPRLPVLVTMTFDEHGRTLSGDDPVAALITLQSLGADAFGCNCSTGPGQMLELIRKMKPFAAIPLVAKPNAGMPHLVNGRTLFEMDAATFGGFASEFAASGANLAGGCCGTTPEHIRALAEGLANCAPRPLECTRPGYIASHSTYNTPAFGDKLKIIGERINPTGKKKLQAELRAGKMELVRDFAIQQTEAGADFLDVNVGLGDIDEKSTMLRAIREVSMVSELPLVIDSTDPAVVEAALRNYCGRALVNSISAEKVRLEKILPIAARYGAMIIILPVADGGVPATAAERKVLVEKIFERAKSYNYTKSDVVVDALVMTVAADSRAGVETLKTVEFAHRDFGTGAVCGLSNVSFGLPARNVLNASFLRLARERGLSCAIANPSTLNAALADPVACRALLGEDPNMLAFLAKFANSEEEKPAAAANAAPENSDPLETLKIMVIKGSEAHISAATNAALAAGISPAAAMDALIDGINVVGEKFSSGAYFLPQLLMSADAMRRAISILEPLLTSDNPAAAGETIVVATVEGDIHDIGKNIVCLMLRNYGFNVIDLGKDVPASTIVETLRQTGAKLCGLSALMTTTMPRMGEVIRLAASENIGNVKFIVGGAAVDADFAKTIGAFYAKDAMQTVNLAKEL